MKKYFCDICGAEGTAPRLMISNEINDKRVTIQFRLTKSIVDKKEEADLCHICLVKMIEQNAKQ